MSLTITSPSFDRIYTMYAWRDNNIRLVLTQGEGLATTDGTVTHVKAPKFQLRDDRGVIDLTSCEVSLALTRPDGSEDLLACSSASGEAAQGIISCPITASATAIAGQATGEIRVLSASGGNPTGIIKFFGVHFQIYKGVSDTAAEQSTEFSALIMALRKVVALDGGHAEMDDLVNGNIPNGTDPVASGNLKTYLEGNYQDYLKARFAKFTYAHEAHSSGYDADSNPVDEYSDGGVYIDDATDMSTLYIIRDSGNMRYGILFCASSSAYNYATQIALYHEGDVKYRRRKNNGTWDEKWTIVNDVLFWSDYESLNINIEFNIEKDKIQDYIKLSGEAPESDSDIPSGYTSDDYKDYASDTDYTESVFDLGSSVYGSEAHGRPDKVEISIPTGGAFLKYKDTVTGREWTESIGLLTSPKTYIQNLIPNHIYIYKVLDANGAVLKKGTARGTGKIRMINAGGDTFNIRDIGGWDTYDWDSNNTPTKSGTLKYGVFYRGGELNNSIEILPAQQEFFRNALGIRDEIDIRKKDQNGDPSAEELVCSLGVGVSYLNQKIEYYSFTSGGSTSVFTDYANYKDVATVIKRIAKDIAENKPIYLHCKAGADRTGMICLFVEAICGVKRDDIDRDYELTAFSKEYKNSSWSRIGRKRNQSFPSYYNSLKDVVAGVNALTDGTNFNDKVVRFLLRTGVTIDEINAIRFGLIDGNPTALTDSYGNATITKQSLTHVLVDNEATSVKLYQSYEANLIVDDWYELLSSNLTITMDGSDAKSYYRNGKLSIPRVTGNIVIAAEATLQTGVISENMLADGAVSTNKIGSKSVTADKLADNAVDATNIKNSAVTSDKINNGAVTPAKLSFSATGYVNANNINDCTENGILYRVYYNGAYQMVICSAGTYIRAQYMLMQGGGVQYRTSSKSGGVWSDWTTWVVLSSGSQIVSGVINANGTITFTDSDENTFTTTGTSVIGPQGDDYILTTQDKSDIANIVLSELPTTQGVLYGN